MANNTEDRGLLVSVLAGIGIGVLVGAVAGLMLAPKSGEQTREDLGQSLDDLNDKVTELGRTLGHKVTSAVDRARAQVACKNSAKARPKARRLPVKLWRTRRFQGCNRSGVGRRGGRFQPGTFRRVCGRPTESKRRRTKARGGNGPSDGPAAVSHRAYHCGAHQDAPAPSRCFRQSVRHDAGRFAALRRVGPCVCSVRVFSLAGRVHSAAVPDCVFSCRPARPDASLL